MAEKPFLGVTLARIVRPRGRRGEVAAEVLTDFPDRLTRLREAWLWDGAHAPRRVAVRSCWLHQGQAVFHFEGAENISDAERLRGLEVQVPLTDRMPLGPGEYYVTDLIGCALWETDAAAALGRVRDVQLTGGTPLLIVDTLEGELLVPLAVEICRRIDVPARRIEVVLPEGLRELNRD